MGVYRGSTLFSAAWGGAGQYTGIDDFSLFGNKRENIDPLIIEHGSEAPVRLITADAFSTEARIKVPNGINVYFYDGDHSWTAQRDAILTWQHKFADHCIYLCDDWNWIGVVYGTLEGIMQSRLQIEYYEAISVPVKVIKQEGNYLETTADSEGWWNGLGIFVLSKPNHLLRR